jgi:hypothetical protein
VELGGIGVAAYDNPCNLVARRQPPAAEAIHLDDRLGTADFLQHQLKLVWIVRKLVDFCLAQRLGDPTGLLLRSRDADSRLNGGNRQGHDHLLGGASGNVHILLGRREPGGGDDESELPGIPELDQRQALAVGRHLAQDLRPRHHDDLGPRDRGPRRILDSHPHLTLLRQRG